jgi:hypothetical protein
MIKVLQAPAHVNGSLPSFRRTPDDGKDPFFGKKTKTRDVVKLDLAKTPGR